MTAIWQDLELMGFLPRIQKSLSIRREVLSAAKRLLFQKCLALLLEPLRQASFKGIQVSYLSSRGGAIAHN
jgi:hypothetical protein